MVKHAYELPEDLVISILECLQVKPLLRFKCVSKSWCNMIASLEFTKNHYQKQGNILLVMRRLRSVRRELVFSFHDLDSPELDQLRPPTLMWVDVDVEINPVIIGHWNGIVFLGYDVDVIICSPVFRVFKIFTAYPTIDLNFSCARWGFRTTTSSFTIVQLQLYTPLYDDCLIKAHLFDSETNSWRECHNTYKVSTALKLEHCHVFFNGACHWLYNSTSILTFHLTNEVFSVLECPNWSTEQVKGSWLKVVDDCLAIIFFREHRYARVIEVWVMKEYGVKESWTKHLVMGPYRVVTPLLFLDKDRVLMEDIHSELATYHTKEKGIKRHGVSGVRNSFEAILYKESLFGV